MFVGLFIMEVLFYDLIIDEWKVVFEFFGELMNGFGCVVF